jgi:hypothetical protein
MPLIKRIPLSLSRPTKKLYMRQFEKEGLNQDLEKVLGIVKKPDREECEPIPRLLEMNKPVKEQYVFLAS